MEANSDTEVMADDAPRIGPVTAEDDEANSRIEGPWSTGHPSIWKVKWTISNFSGLEDGKVYSPRFDVAGCTWCVLLFPKGMGMQNPPNSQLSIFLDSRHMHSDAGFSCQGVFELSVINTNPLDTETKGVQHKFTCEEGDWGFQNFIKLSLLTDKDKGFLPNDTLSVLVTLRVIKDEEQREFKQCALPDHWLHDSKSETGFVGLQNQGATCYMNSLLQALYHVPFLRKAVYEMPTEDEIKSKDGVEQSNVHPAVVIRGDKQEEESVALALQRVFFKLQHSSQSVETKQLTRSFGWDSYDAFTQHDVQELDRVLCDNLEEKMKGTPVEGVVPELLSGKLKNYVRCLNVDFTSERIEDFYDLSLNVRGCKNVIESLKQYVEKENLDGDNKYMAEGHGLQDAEKGCTFQKLPPILHLHLKRFEYDPLRDANVKVNDRFEFDEEIDLTGFEEGPDSEGQPLIYKLHSVLVHSGDMHGGHYFSFVRPDCETNWYKFNDERVTQATPAEAIAQNYGCSDEGAFNMNGPRKDSSTHKKFSNAYMLVYVRASEIPKVLVPLTEKDIPEHLRKRFEKEEREQLQAPHKMNVRFVDDQMLSQHRDSSFVNWDKVMVIGMMKQDTVADFKKIISEIKGTPVAQQRLWTFAMRENNTIRIDRALQPEDDDSCLQDIKQASSALRLYLEVLPPPPKQKPVDKRKDALIAVKEFNVENQSLKYMGSILLPVTTLVGDLVEVIEKKINLPASETLAVWEEVTDERIEEPEMDQSFQEARIGNGDILVFQRVPKEEAVYSAAAAQTGGPIVKCRTVPEYYEYLQYRVTVRVRKLAAPDRDLFNMELSMKHYYKQVAHVLAAKMLETGHLDEEIDPLRIQLYKHHPHHDRPHDTPAHRSSSWQLEDIISSYQVKDVPILYVEVMGYSLLDLETQMLFKMRCPAARKEHGDKDHEVLVPKQSTAGQAIEALKKALTSVASANLVLCWVQDHKIVLINKPGQPLEDVSGSFNRSMRSSGSLGGHHYALELPDGFTPEELVSAADDEVGNGNSEGAGSDGVSQDASARGAGSVWKVCHVDVERSNKGSASKFHDDPFLISVQPNETVKSFKERLPGILQGKSGDEIGNWGVRKVYDTAGDLGAPMDEDALLLSPGDDQHVVHIGLVHPETRDKYASNTNRSTERAIKISR
mmetsp:Transcript_31511/g.77222  ORF Transcript_31511/g.77222 Transcript_31511/m.77222 type:complete len:1170 (-) Transcript_31511:337-3846(-)